MVANSNWLGPAGPERREAFERALTTAGAGSVLLQTFINRVVQQIHLRELGASAVLPRRPGSGNAAYINRRTPGADAEWVDDTDSATEIEGSYAQVSFPYQTLLTRGKVTRFLQATGRSYGDILAGEISGRAGDFGQTFEAGLITGDTGADPKQFDGLLTLVGAVASQVIAQSTAVAGDVLTLDKLDEAIDVVKGSAARSDLVILASFKGRRLLNTALQAQQQFNDLTEIAAGFRVRTYDGIPIVTTTAMPDVLTWSGSAITSFSGAATTALLIVNTRYVWIEELTPMTVAPLANESTQYDLFEIYCDAALAYSNTLGAAILAGIDAS